MIDKKKIKEQYKNTIPEKGVYAIKNIKTGRTFLAGTLNLYNVLERNKMLLNFGSHLNKQLQKDWQSLGETAFSFEVLEKLKPNEDPAYNYDEDLKILEMLWIDKFQPICDNCYNESENIRLV